MSGHKGRVWLTADGRHVRDGHPDAVELAYGEDDDVPKRVLDELAGDAPDATEASTDAESEHAPAKRAAKRAPARKAAAKPADKSAGKSSDK